MNKSSLFVSMAVVISLVFTLSCVSKEVPVTETYYETEYRTESYVETTKSGQEYITPKWKQYIPGLYFPALEWSKLGAGSHLDGYEIDTAKVSKGQIKLVLSNSPQATLWYILVVNLTGLGPLPAANPQGVWWKSHWVHYLNFIIIEREPERILYSASSDQHASKGIVFDVTGVEEFAVITCTPMIMGPVIEKVQLIWFKEVTKERQVPYQSEKQRTVIEIKKIPFWEAMLTGGAPTTCVPGEEGQTEYVNEEYGFSVKYPSDWVERPELVTSPFHVAVFGVVDYTPGIAIVAANADAPISVDWLIESYQEMGNSNVKILSPLTGTILADGTKATTYKANYIAASGYEVTAFCLDTDKGNKRIRLVVWTVEEYVPYDEAKFSEIAHTLRFTMED